MSTICATCCSRNRILSTISLEYWNVLNKLLSSCKSLILIKDYVWSESLKICVECNKMIQNIIHFRDKVLKSIKIFEDTYNKQGQSEFKTGEQTPAVHHTELTLDMGVTTENIFVSESIKIESDNFSVNNELGSKVTESAQNDSKFVQVHVIKSECLNRDRIAKDENKPDIEFDDTYTVGIKSEDESTDTSSEEEIDEASPLVVAPKKNAVKGNEKLKKNTSSKNNPGPSKSNVSPKERPKGRHLSSIEKKIAVNLYNRLVTDASNYPFKDEAKKKAAEIMGISKTTMYRALKEDSAAPQSTSKQPTWYIRMLSDEEVLKEMEECRSTREFTDAADKCEPCALVFRNSQEQAEHAHLFHNAETGHFSCQFCSRNFTSGTELEDHYSQHYKRYICILCLFEGDNIDAIKDHKCSYDETIFKRSMITKKFLNESKQYKCELCSKDFHYKGIKDRHMELIHGNKQQTAQCKLCFVTLKNEYSLPGHMKWHKNQARKASRVTPELAEFYYCKSCNVQFDKKHLYKQHLKTSMKHIKQEELKCSCNYCDRKFLSPCHVRRHTNAIHFKQNGYKCNQCDKSYSTKTNLRLHIEWKHENKPKEKKYICEVCASAFASNNILKAHMRRHTGERPFACKRCSATFSYSGALYTHNKLVHENVKKTWKKNKKKKTE